MRLLSVLVPFLVLCAIWGETINLALRAALGAH